MLKMNIGASKKIADQNEGRFSMNPLTLEWAQEADGEYNAAQLLAKAASPIHDAICFHAQQCVEKYLKAARSQYRFSKNA